MTKSAWACWGTTRFPAGSWEASSFAIALCGVSPRLLFPRESRSSPASPDIKWRNGPHKNARKLDLLPNMAGFRSFVFGKGGRETARLLREKEVDETPQGGFPEEARQLARGKRVVSRPTLR
ncbi:hypothetical protein N780_18060 [Pontibacillus chungwhensis BH030062]|uniref:Uncharacterized protein n=1 Tax=Pontibacillus chungwhensis BH030062 TaxID=1385513 RepID=A0A0A2VDK4_9BACI|nr:hypothetical protein N780_18060 [Pontibacillus chungwhensis BH030062]